MLWTVQFVRLWRNMAKTTKYLLIICCSIWLTHGSKVKNITSGVSRHIRSIGFPEGSGMGIFFAIGIPVDIPDKSVSFSFYFEANYGLPSSWNSTYYDEPYYNKRSLDRNLAYSVLEAKFDSLGYSGYECVLRTICEAKEYPLSENGLLGDILRIIFTPSSSQNENLSKRIQKAEKTKNCDAHYKACPISLFGLIS
ncbi:uncharacterized protein [Prorops nasuta]|uniref:uncharacterized protein n=1 Tax=Prorops nasuta TaxID=863751 RepID=UPI0034D021F6